MSSTLFPHLLTHTYLVHVKRMDAHLSGGVLGQDQTGELTLPYTAAWAYSPGIRSMERECKNEEKSWTWRGGDKDDKMTTSIEEYLL